MRDYSIIYSYDRSDCAIYKSIASIDLLILFNLLNDHFFSYGSVREITAVDYVQEVNKAGEDVFVVLHLYKQGVPLCALINEYMNRLAPKFPCTKFLRAISTTCIPNYPDKNLPTIFVYYEGQMKGQMVGPIEFRGMNLTMDEFEYLIGKTGAIKTEIKSDPKPKVKDVMMSSLRGNKDNDDLSDEGDW